MVQIGEEKDGEAQIAFLSSLVILSLLYIVLILCHESLGNAFKVCPVNATQRGLQVPQQNQNQAECISPRRGSWRDGCMLTWKSFMSVYMAKLCIGDAQP